MPNHPLLDEWQDRIAEFTLAQLRHPSWYNEVQIRRPSPSNTNRSSEAITKLR